MPAKDLGTKHTCFKCSTKFYDLKKPDPVCPKCGTDQRESPSLRAPQEGRRGRLAAAAPKVIEPVEPEEAEAAEEEELETFEEEDEDLPSEEDEEI